MDSCHLCVFFLGGGGWHGCHTVNETTGGLPFGVSCCNYTVGKIFSYIFHPHVQMC